MKNKGPNRAKKGTLGRLIKTLFEFYPVKMPIVLFCIIFSAVVSSIPAIFMQNVIAIVETSWKSGDWDAVSGKVFYYVGLLLVFYILSILSAITYTQMMAGITQGFLKKLRVKMFNGMQDLPVRYFDTHNHGDIMSYYTNDIDTLRQMVSQSIPQLLISSITVLTVFSIMLYFSVWMTIVVVRRDPDVFCNEESWGEFCKIFCAPASCTGKSGRFCRRDYEWTESCTGFLP